MEGVVPTLLLLLSSWTSPQLYVHSVPLSTRSAAALDLIPVRVIALPQQSQSRVDAVNG